MYKITTRDQIRSVAAKWMKQYGSRCTGRFKDVHDRLLALDADAATAADVEAIIGNDSWTGITCNECGSDVEAAIEIGEERDWESSTATVCLKCLRSAVSMLDNAAEPAH